MKFRASSTQFHRTTLAIVASIAISIIVTTSRYSKWFKGSTVSYSDLSPSLSGFLRAHVLGLSENLGEIGQDKYIGVNGYPEAYPLDPANKTTRYLAYIPHSGFHNQRNALENAIDLARILNRTLLLPPAVLGTPSIGWKGSWSRSMDLMNKVIKFGLSQRSSTGICGVEGEYVPTHCIANTQPENTVVSWAWLMNIRSLKDVRIVDRPYMSYKWINDNLGIPREEIRCLKEDNIRDSWQFYDQPTFPTTQNQYVRHVNVDAFKENGLEEARLIHLGSTFGARRMILNHDKELRKAHARTVNAMAIHNTYIANTSQALLDIAGGTSGGNDKYFAVHLRGGDGGFLWFQQQKVLETLREFLKGGDFNMTKAQISEIAGKYTADVRSSIPLPEAGTLFQSGEMYACASPPRADYPQLNTRIWVATDVPDPRRHPITGHFFTIFPCAFTMSDPEPQRTLATIPGLVDINNGVILSGRFMAAFLDIWTASNSRYFQGTSQSTFSRYIKNFLQGYLHTTHL